MLFSCILSLHSRVIIMTREAYCIFHLDEHSNCPFENEQFGSVPDLTKGRSGHSLNNL